MTSPIQIQDELRAELVNTGEGTVKILDLDVRQIEDVEGLRAWRVVLYLTPPDGDAWDVEVTRALKRDARSKLDQLLWDAGIEIDGVTSAVVTSRPDVTPVDDLAAIEEPELGENSSSEMAGDDE